MIYRPFKENHYTALPEGTNSKICLSCLHSRKLIALVVSTIISSYNTTVWEASVTYCYGYMCDRLCGLVVRVSGYRYRGPGFDSRRYQIF